MTVPGWFWADVLITYIESNMMPGEEVRCIGALHWIMYIRPAIGVVVCSIFVLFMIVVDPGMGGVKLFSMICLALSLFAMIRVAIIRMTMEIGITDRRVIHKVGLVSRSVSEMSLGKVESVPIHQGIAGRILGYGTIDVRGTGVGLDEVKFVKRPTLIRNAILGQNDQALR